MEIRDRVRELRRVRAAELKPNPRNWRTHPTLQRDALRGILAEVGYADALLVRELNDGSLELIDGHLRAETTPDAIVPVLILDVNKEEAAMILATHDPLASLAETDTERLDTLLGEVATDNPALQSMLDGLANISDEETGTDPRREPIIPETHQVIIDCSDEDELEQVYEKLTTEGYRCRVLSM